MARFFIPAGGMVGQPAESDGSYSKNTTPWKQHDSIPEEEWEDLGEMNTGLGKKVKIWKRILIVPRIE
jgi:hypothetical protein